MKSGDHLYYEPPADFVGLRKAASTYTPAAERALDELIGAVAEANRALRRVIDAGVGMSYERRAFNKTSAVIEALRGAEL